MACLTLALVTPTLAWIEHVVLQRESLMNRVDAIFDQRQADFATLREFSELASAISLVLDG